VPPDPTAPLFAWPAGSPSLMPRGAATIKDGKMILANGAMNAPGAGHTLSEALQLTHELTLECIFTPDTLNQSGLARIVTLSRDAYHRNVTLGQSGDNLVPRLRTPHTGDNGAEPEVTFGTLKAGTHRHVVVSYTNGVLSCYQDGQQVLFSDQIRGDLCN